MPCSALGSCPLRLLTAVTCAPAVHQHGGSFPPPPGHPRSLEPIFPVLRVRLHFRGAHGPGAFAGELCGPRTSANVCLLSSCRAERREDDLRLAVTSRIPEALPIVFPFAGLPAGRSVRLRGFVFDCLFGGPERLQLFTLTLGGELSR